eukprot:m.310883 g.310883  ORF g.310883 m.310883 type:complete len:217 (-) comp55357_c0_seq11:859-1509(-)
MIPTAEVVNGSFVFTVSDQNNVGFAIGTTEYSVLGFDGQVGLAGSIVQAGGVIDTRMSAAAKSLSDSISTRISTADSTTTNSFSASLNAMNLGLSAALSTTLVQAMADSASRKSMAISAAAADATTKTSSALSSANSYTVVAVAAGKSELLSTIRVADTSTLTAAIANTDSVRVVLLGQISGSFASLFCLVFVFFSSLSSNIQFGLSRYLEPDSNG